MGPSGSQTEHWWRTGLLYQIYVRSFLDTDGDGVGDLKGVTDRLEYLSWLGVDGVWLSPVTVSANADWGYDVSDYRSVQPEYGTLADLDLLVERANSFGIHVLLDLVPNHTSNRHAWFEDSRSSRRSPRRDFYVWADAKADGAPPNNWVSCFGGPAWTFDESSGQYYLHNFLPEQPDLNWWNDEVRDEFDGILRFWWDRGIEGFRIDVCNMIVKDAELRDNPPATEDDPFIMQMFGQRPEYTSNRPEVHDVLRRWRKIADQYDPPRILLGETNVEAIETLALFYGSGGDELSMGFNFPFIESPFEAAALSAIVEQVERLLPEGAWPVWTGSNHDVSRLATRWAAGDEKKVKLALLMLLTLRGTPVLYQGDEIGHVDGDLRREQLRDPVGIRFWPAYKGRDPERTPMPWSSAPNGGFTSPHAAPWLPMSDPAGQNVENQRGEPDSVLNFVHEAIELRRSCSDLSVGAYTPITSPDGTWVFGRGSDTVVALNMSDSKKEVASGRRGYYRAFGTHREHAGAPSVADDPAQSEVLFLAPWEGVVLRAR